MKRFDPQEVEQLKQKHSPFSKMPLLETFLHHWVNEIVYPNKTRNTFTTYRSMIQAHIIPMIGGYYLDEIDQDIIILYMNKKMEYGRSDETGGLSAKTIHAHINMLKQALRYAVEIGLLPFNPCMNIQLPKIIRKEVEVYSVEEQTKLNRSIDTTWKPNSMLCAYLGNMLGLRIGEVAALRLDDIDFHTREIRIDETLGRVSVKEQNRIVSRIVIGTPKSKRVRSLPMSDEVYSMLWKYIHTMPEEQKKDPHAFLFTNRKGNPMEPRGMNYHYKKYIAELHISNHCFHTLRHTFATRGIEMNVEMKTLSTALGHRSSAVTEDFYIHISESQLKREICQITTDNIEVTCMPQPNSSLKTSCIL